MSETAAPHRLGAALTYARRYALFTLVGIAGEDDLDAPDLPAAVLSAEAQNGSVIAEQRSTATEPKPGRALQTAEKRTRAEKAKPATLPPEVSATLLDRLISELAQLGELEALAAWAHRVLPLKNQLMAADAERVEAAFAARLSELSDATQPRQSQRRGANGHESHRLEADPGANAA